MRGDCIQLPLAPPSLHTVNNLTVVIFLLEVVSQLADLEDDC